MRSIRLVLPALLLATAVACAPDDRKDFEAGDWDPGKADGAFAVMEAGPLPFDREIRVGVSGQVPAYRVQSFGNTKITIDARAFRGSDPYLWVEGPLADDGDKIAPGGGVFFAGDDDSGDGGLRDAHLELVLKEPGVYRVVVSTWTSFVKGRLDRAQVDLAATCTENCYRPMLTAKEFFTKLRASGKLDLIIAGFEQQLATKIPDETTRGLVIDELRAIAASSDFDGLERFPTVPLALLGELRPALGLISGEAPEPDKVITGSLAEILGACNPGRLRPPGMSPQLPEIGMEQFPNLALSPCQAAHSGRLARVFTALAADNGSYVDYKGRRLTTPAQLADALIGSGHTIIVRNERTYANFLSFTYGDYDVQWPTWLDTGVTMPDGKGLSVPMGHSHHAWIISGPDVNATVMFYLGISGAGFWGKTGVRAAWSGEVGLDETSSNDDPQMILATLEAASTYFHRTRIERDSVAQGMPIDGYGYVGVCNDSNAIIEKATRGTVTTFPLLRAVQLDSAPDIGDGLDEVVRSLPNDADVPAGDEDTMRRVLLMTPHDLDSPLVPDELLRSQLKTARDLLGEDPRQQH